MFISSRGIVEEISINELNKIKKHALQEINAEFRKLLNDGMRKSKVLNETHFWGTYIDINSFFSLMERKNKVDFIQCLFITFHRLEYLLNFVDLFRGDQEMFDPDAKFEDKLQEIGDHLKEATGWDPRTRFIHKNDPRFVQYE